MEAEIFALQQRSAEAVAAGKADETWLKNTAQLFGALEQQKNRISSGQMDQKPEKLTAGESAIAQAEQELRRLVLGKDQAAIMSLKAADATGEEINALRNLQQQIAIATEEEKKLQEAKRKADETAARKETMDKQAENQIASMRDQIDLLTGAASKGEIALRDMVRQGFTAEQAKEAGDLTDKIDALQEKTKKPKGDRSSSMKAALSGSSEAASLLVRGIGGGKTMEQLANKSLTVQQQMLMAIKDNKPPELQPLTLGT